MGAWRGLQDVEDSWESLGDLQRDIPVVIDEYIATHEAADLQDHLALANQSHCRYPTCMLA